MSGNASIAAAHRRRASAAKTTNSKFAQYSEPNNRVNNNSSENVVKKPTINLPDALALLSGQISELRKYRDDNNQHWKEHDEFLGIICPKIDQVVDFIEKYDNLEKRVELLENELRKVRADNESEK